MIRLFVIDDQNVIAGSLRKRLMPFGFSIAGEAPDIENAIHKIDPSSIDILILDLLIRDTDPVQNIKTLRKNFPDIPVVILSQEHAIIWQVKMCQEGAKAFINKLETSENLARKLTQVFNGQTVTDETPHPHPSEKTNAAPPVKPRISEKKQTEKNSLWDKCLQLLRK